MSIHQVSIRYLMDQDRLLLRVRTQTREVFELWLTRRMMSRLWTPLQNSAQTISLRGLSTSSTILPEAREMMTRTLQEQSRSKADFESAFDDRDTARPLGAEPMLVHTVDLRDLGGDRLECAFRDSQGRQLALQLNGDLIRNLVTLLEQGLHQAEWGLPMSSGPGAAGEAPGSTPQRMLN